MCVNERASECVRLNDRYFVFIIQSNMTDFNGHSLFYEIIAVCRVFLRWSGQNMRDLILGVFFSFYFFFCFFRPGVCICNASVGVCSFACVCESLNCVNIVKCSKSNYLYILRAHEAMRIHIRKRDSSQ